MPENKPVIDSSINEPSNYNEEYNRDEISLSDLFLSLWRYRGVIVIVSLIVTTMMGAVCGIVFLGQEKKTIVTQAFKIEFDGIDKNEYPSGIKFSTSDILGSTVLNKVFKDNDLSDLIDYQDFKSALSITQTNDTLRLLEFEYSAILGNNKLSLDERKRLESEFLEKKQNTLIPIYSLMFSFSTRVQSIPQSLIAKVLLDILEAWAEFAVLNKGANNYQISIISKKEAPN